MYVRNTMSYDSCTCHSSPCNYICVLQYTACQCLYCMCMCVTVDQKQTLSTSSGMARNGSAPPGGHTRVNRCSPHTIATQSSSGGHRMRCYIHMYYVNMLSWLDYIMYHHFWMFNFHFGFLDKIFLQLHFCFTMFQQRGSYVAKQPHSGELHNVQNLASKIT